jgi:hypothetical protein
VRSALASFVLLAGLIYPSSEARSQNFPSRLAEIRVADFGARCDGATDDSAAIQTALDAAENLAGARVVFPAGSCVAANLQVHSNTIVQGQGNATTVRLKSASDNTSALFVVSAADHISFQFLQMDGNASGQRGAPDFTSTIVRLASNGPGTGPAQVSLYRVTLHDAFGHHFLSYVQGAAGDRPSSFIAITESTFTNSGTDAIYWDDIDHLSVTDNTISNWGLSTAEADGIGGYTRGHRYGYTISRNRLSSGAGRKFSVELFQQGVGDDYNDVDLGDNVLIGNSGWNGFSVSLFNGNIHNNVFTGGGGSNTRSGLWEMALSGSVVTGNVVENGILALTPSYPGIVLGSTAITGNIVITGPFADVNALAIGGTINNVNVTGNLIDVTGATNCSAITVGVSDGVRASASQVTIGNNQILDTANRQVCTGINLTSFDGATGAAIQGNTISGMGMAVFNAPNPTVGTTGISIVGNDLQGNAVLVANNGTGLLTQSGNITTPGQTIEMLAGGTYIDSSGNAVVTSGALAPETFTPAGIGWYRILSTSGGGGLGGLVRIAGASTDSVEFQFAETGYAAPLTAARGTSRTRFPNFTGGIIDQFRVSDDNNGSVALDIHMAVMSLQPITLFYVGPNIPPSAVIASPVIGATPLSGGTTVIFGSTFGTGMGGRVAGVPDGGCTACFVPASQVRPSILW